MSTRRLRLAAGTIALVAALVVLLKGPTHEIVCGSGSVLDGFAEALRSSHIDGADASWCTVPTTLTWVLTFTLAALGIVLVGSAVFGKREARPLDVPGGTAT